MKRIIASLLALALFATAAQAEPSFRRQKNLDTFVCGTILNSTTAVSIGAAVTGLDCEVDLYTDAAAGDGYADLATAETVVGTTGQFCAKVLAAEVNSTYASLRCQATNTNAAIWVADIDTTHGTVLTNSSGQLDTGTIPESAFPARGTAQSATGTTLRLAASEAFADDELNGNTAVHIVSASAGAGQTRCVDDYVASTDTATVQTWTTTPTGTITYDLVRAPHCDALQPTTVNTRLDVTATGAAGIDWGNVENKTTTNALTGTTVVAGSVSIRRE